MDRGILLPVDGLDVVVGSLAENNLVVIGIVDSPVAEEFRHVLK